MSYLAKKLASAFLSVGLVLGLGACGGNDVLKDQKFTGTGTLQGTVMNAITGEHIGGDDLQLFLVQGADVRSPDRLVKDTSDPLVGEYAFNDVPTVLPPQTITYKVIAIKGGFQRFEGEVEFDTDVYFQQGVLADNTVIANTAYTKIGNIYLFPVGTVAPDYTYTVLFNGKPVPNATVRFSPDVQDNESSTEINSNTIYASAGYLPGLAATTDANGVVTFAGSSLALGACYKPVVDPIVFDGVQLGLKDNTSYVVVGKDVTTGILNLRDLTPGSDTYGLYVTSVSNTPSGQIDPTGTLTIHFSRAVALVNATGFSASENSLSGVLNATQPVTATLSADGLTLTLVPNWSTAPTAGEINTDIIYGNGTASVSVVGYPASSFTVFGDLLNANGNTISGTVQMTGP